LAYSRSKTSKKGFGKVAKNRITIQFEPDLNLSESLQDLKESLEIDKTNFFIGTVSIDDLPYPAIFIPFTQEYRGSTKLYSHVCFCPENKPKVNRSLIDKISEKVARKVIKITRAELS